MKLVEILARELNEWPSCTDIVGQAVDGTIHFCASFEKNMHGNSEQVFSLADDAMCSDVTRSQWEAERARILEKSSRFTEKDKASIERARIAANQQATQEAREIARTGSMTSEEQELADIACGKRSNEDQEQIKEVTSPVSVGYMLERDYEAEEAKQYDQELWDKLAIAAMQGLLSSGATYKGSTTNRDLLALDAFAHADAFMAERAKRMKG